jgi:hypothetical protein
MKSLGIAAMLCALIPTAAVAQTAETFDKPTLAPQARKAVQTALNSMVGEYAGVALYAKTVQKFGKVQPYSRLLEAEVKQRSAVQKLLRKYGVTYGDNPYLKKAKTPASLKQAAGYGIQLAEGNLRLYDKLLPEVAEYPDITRLFQKMQAETRDLHLSLLRTAEANGGVNFRRSRWNH